jgi:hypothetical protein
MDSHGNEDAHRTGGPDNPATGTTGVGRTEDTEVGPQDAARDINPGGGGAAAPDPKNPDSGA